MICEPEGLPDRGRGLPTAPLGPDCFPLITLKGVGVASHKIFSVYDSKANAFLLPFFAVNGRVALRMFERAVNDESTDFHRFSSDYTLFEVGEWDQDSGEVFAYGAKVSLGLAAQFAKAGVGLVKEVRSDGV